MLILSREEIEPLISMSQTIDIMKQAFMEYASHKTKVPVRTPISVEKKKGQALFMPAYLEETEGLGLKVVTVFPENHKKGQPTIYGVILLNDVETGKPLALMDASYITALRTGAVSGLATAYLAKQDAKVVTVFGAGKQARTQLEAVCAVREIERVHIFDYDHKAALVYKQDMEKVLPRIQIDVLKEQDKNGAVTESDIIITATTSKEPVFDGRYLEPGTHINAVGSFRSDMQEVDSITLQKSKIIVDSLQAVLDEAGDIIIPLSKKVIQQNDIMGELGDIFLNNTEGRINDEEITYFKSVGLAIQDISVGKYIYDQAKTHNIGQEIELS